MDLRLIFDEDAANYDRCRPVYVPELFAAVAAYADLRTGRQALEIGIGTGQATRPVLETGCRVTAVEPGAHLAAFCQRKFRDFPDFKVVCTDFERFEAPAGGFDLIYSATAFHWVPQEIGCPKSMELLKPGGTLALFWNHPFVNRPDDPLHAEIQKYYRRYRPSKNPPPAEFDESACESKRELLRRCGFADVACRLFRQTRVLGAAEYLALLNTYSDHRALPAEAKAGLERGIGSAIGRFGGTLRIYDTMDLYLARKPAV